MAYLRNTWYVAAWSDEVGAKPLGRKILGEPMVLYRDAAGRVVATVTRSPVKSRTVPRKVTTGGG